MEYFLYMKRLLHKIAVRLLAIIVLGLFSDSLSAAKLSGVIRDDRGEPLPFVNVFIKGTTRGTTANPEGVYSLELEPGAYTVIFKLIGFRQKEEAIRIMDSVNTRDVVLFPETYLLKEVTIRAGAEDPAYAIIRKAQKKRKFYQNEVQEYNCHAYVKSTQRLVSYPKTLFGQKVEMGEFLDTTTGIFYLSESVSDLSVGSSGRIRERMISSKVSGDARTYSFNQASDLLFSFYDNIVNLAGLTPRGIVSPIASGALLYYDYKLEGTFLENGVMVNKIRVIPKRVSDPVFTGDIFILDDTWRIHSLNLFITKSQQVEFVDTFQISQTFLPVEKDIWMPFSNQFEYVFSFMGFHGSGLVMGIFSSYNIHPDFEKGYFDGKVMSVDKEANTKDSTYWNENRPVPLSLSEKSDYERKDSIHARIESKSYKDSMDHINNSFSFMDLLTGYTYRNTFRHTSLSVSSPIPAIQFNTVEGWNSEIRIKYVHRFGNEDRRNYSIQPSVRYGLSNNHWNAHIMGEYRYNGFKLSDIRIDAGTDVLQFNQNNPITPLINSIYSLWARKNYMKVYESRFIMMEHESEIWNGFRFGIKGEYANRIPLSNTTDYAFVTNSSRNYSDNNPFFISGDSSVFAKNQALIAELNCRIRIRQEYVERPEGKYITGSRFPEVTVTYRKGIPGISSDVQFDFAKLAVGDNWKMGLLGRLTFWMEYGKFISRKHLYPMDLMHFNGNRTWFSDFRINDFRGLDYYSYSTLDQYIQVHAEQNLGGFFLNKIPLIRKLKFSEILGVHYLHVQTRSDYLELTAGIEKLNLFRAEIFTSFADGRKGTIGAVFGLKRLF